MSDDTPDVLRQAEEAAARRAADQEQYAGTDRAAVHRLLDAIDDDGLIAARWLLEVAWMITLPYPKQALSADRAEHLVPVASGPDLVQRWINFVNALVPSVPASWFDTPERRERVRLWLQAAAIRAFDVDVPLPGGEEGP